MVRQPGRSGAERSRLCLKKNSCVNCGLCVDACPVGIHEITPEGIHRVRRDIDCTGCGKCKSVCPQAALEVNGQVKTVSELLEIVDSKIQDIDNGALQEDTVYNTSNSHAMRGQEISLYAEDNFNVNARLSLNAGVRTSLFHTQGKSYYSLQPRLSARYDLGQGYSAKASYTCMAQYVHLLSSTPLSMPTDLWVPITKDISPMYANQFSIGGYYSGLPGWEFSVEGYYKQMKHILEYQDGVSFFGTSTNWEEKVGNGRRPLLRSGTDWYRKHWARLPLAGIYPIQDRSPF